MALTKAIASERLAASARNSEEERRAEAVASLYQSLVRETVALRASRASGYRERAWELLHQAAQLDTPARDLRKLRREAVLCLGDFIGLSPKVLHFQRERVSGLALSSGGTVLAVGLSNGDVVLYDLSLAKEWTRLRKHTAPVCCITYSSDDNLLVTGDREGTVHTWRRSSAGTWAVEQLCQIEHDNTPSAGLISVPLRVMLTPDSKRAWVHYYRNPEVQLLDLETGNVTAQLRDEEPQKVLAATLSSDGKLLATTSSTKEGCDQWNTDGNLGRGR